MISKMVKKVVGIEKNKKIIPLKHHLIPSCSFLLYKGYEPHYQWFDLHHHQFHQHDQFYCYDRAVVDIALQMAVRRTKILTYVSSRNYETVCTTSKTLVQQKNQPFQSRSNKGLSQQASFKSLMSKQQKIAKNINNKVIESDVSQEALKIIKDCRFTIKTSSADIHPYECYHKMCGYLNNKSESNIVKSFQNFGCSDKILFDCFILVPFLSKIRKRFLVTDQLKLQSLQRRPNITITQQMVRQYVAQWTKIIDIDIPLSAYSSFAEQTKLDWTIQHNLGQIISKQQIIKEKNRRYFYATWN